MSRYKVYSAKDAFWKSAVSAKHPDKITGLWTPKNPVKPESKIATLGSCFAARMGQAITSNGFNWFNAEPGPGMLSAPIRRQYNYDIFSARTGNIYSIAMFHQWFNWALSNVDVPSEVWQNKERFYDPFRPHIEPEGFVSAAELETSRRVTLEAIRKIVAKADVLILTLGLTETWIHKELTYAFAMFPGVIENCFDESLHVFANDSFVRQKNLLHRVVTLLHQHNPDLHIVISLSPVPLIATATGQHVLVSNTSSKSVLRSVAGEVASEHSYVDYFPSYEIITAAPFGGKYFHENLRTVTDLGVKKVMDEFFGYKQMTTSSAVQTMQSFENEDDDLCEELLLAKFNNKDH